MACRYGWLLITLLVVPLGARAAAFDFIAMLQHISNTHLLGGGENLGETMLLAGVKF